MDEVSPDTYVNIMGQYRPQFQVDGEPKYAAINRPPSNAEMKAVRQVAREAGLWRFDQRN